MNLKFVFMIALTLGLGISAYAQYEAQYISPSVPEMAVYCGTTIGNSAYFLCVNETVIAVRDGERLDASFLAAEDDCEFGGASKNLIAFADSLTGFAISTSGFYETHDGARHWKYNSLGRYNIKAVTFVDSLHGWALGSGVYRTTDKGKTWHRYYDETMFQGYNYFKCLYAINKDTLWALKSFYYSNGGEIYFSTDGGKKWRQQSFDIQVDKQHQLFFYDIKVKPNGVGIISACIYYPDSSLRKTVFLRTRDFGAHWETIYPGYHTNYHSVLFLNDTLWLAYGQQTQHMQPYGFVAVSRDTGKTWEERALYLGGHYWQAPDVALYFPQKDEILIATTYDYFVSKDHGQTFTQLQPQYKNKIVEFDIDTTAKGDQQLAIALPQGGEYYFLSTDGGENWQPDSVPLAINPVKHVFVRNSKIFLFSQQGGFLYSSDKGKSWTHLKHRYVSPYISSLAACSDKYFLAYDNSPNRFYLFERQNDSLITHISFINKNVEMKDYTLIPPSTIVACGRDIEQDVGFAFYSSDGGYNWRITDIPFINRPERVQMVTSKVGYINNLREVYKTIDGGRHWERILKSNNYYVFYSGFVFTDPLHGIMRGPYYFLQTDDGGMHWERKGAKGFRDRIRHLAINNKGNLLALTKAGYLIRFYDPNKPESQPSLPPEVKPSAPKNSALWIYPNPFNLTAKIRFKISKAGKVHLTVYNALGQKVATLVDGYLSPGNYIRTFESRKMASGIYFVTLQTQGQHWVKKALLIK